MDDNLYGTPCGMQDLLLWQVKPLTERHYLLSYHQGYTLLKSNEY
jgi:hypothetical protein